ncbi:MAG: hypothetical protein IJB34_00045 [Clostridia bacterium]|nr:hypothetical protein [Clostridia bacterium]MBQ3505789.1 hypothetical protein [Clostridia bacterium]
MKTIKGEIIEKISCLSDKTVEEELNTLYEKERIEREACERYIKAFDEYTEGKISFRKCEKLYKEWKKAQSDYEFACKLAVSMFLKVY